jgi:hypothetical protein
LIEGGLVELKEAFEKDEVKFMKWHFEQVKNYVNALDVAYQRITWDEEIGDDATIEAQIRIIKE